MKDTAWLYAAVSSSPQEATLDDQRRWGEEVARANGWAITRVFSGTASGKLGTRRILDETLAELTATPKAQRPERLLMIRLDRTGRVALETIAALAQIKRLGCVIHTRTEGDVKLETALDALRPIFELVSAELENSGRSDKMRAVHARWRDAGRHFGPAPYGTAKDPDGRLIVRDPQATFVRRAFELRATGAGYIRIARDVGRYAPPQGMYAGRPRMTWHQHSIAQMLRCRSYRGLVVPEELWDRVQTVRNPDWRATRAQRVYPWPLSGILTCFCGWSMAGIAGGRKGGRIRYYACRHPRHHPLDARPSIRADYVERWFTAQLGELVASPELVEAASRRTAEEHLTALRQSLAAARAELEDLDRQRRMAWGLQADGRIAAGELAERLEELRASRETVAARIVDLERSYALSTAQDSLRVDAGEIIGDAAERYAHASPDDQKEIARIVAILLEGLYYSEDGTLRFGIDETLPNTVAFTTR
jgi:DNA invertase Pin-like site-specific DNA recombinase